MTAVASTSVDPLAPATLGAHAKTLLQRDRWSRKELLDYQQEHLRGLIRHAVEHSPYYRAALGPGAERCLAYTTEGFTLGAVQQARPAQQRAVAAHGEQAVELLGRRQELRPGIGPQGRDRVFGIEREPEPRGGLSEANVLPRGPGFEKISELSTRTS